MNCDEAEELLGAYALDALPGEEMAAMRAHLAGCEKHAASASELRGVAMRFPALADSIDAPLLLRGRVLDAIAREAAARDRDPRRIADGASRGAPTGVLWRPSGFRYVSRNAWAALAAALVIAVGGLLAWNVVLMNRDEANVDRLASRATSAVALKPAAGGASGTVVYFGQEKKALVIVDGLAQLDATNNVYQMWAVGDGNPKSIGLMQAGASGRANSVVDFDGSRTRTLAITVEPAGGSAQPTTEPILTATCIAPAADCTS